MTELEQTLTEIGLEPREAKLYLAVLELGEETVLPISKKAGIARTYCYDILEALQKKNLVTYYEKNGRRRYMAEPPEKIRTMLAGRMDTFARSLPELASLYHRGGHKPRVRFYEGLAGISAIYDEIVTHQEYWALASSQLLEAHFGDQLQRLAKTVVARGIRARELLAHSDQPPSFVQAYTGELQQVRYLPAGVKLQTDMVIYGNKLVLISYGADVHAVMIEDSAIVDTHRKLYELLWELGEVSSL